MSTEPLVSVVTPVYNGEPYLAECIESVLAQTHAHWEYVIVNNRSTDRSREIAEDYARKDGRIRVHNNDTFLPLIANHNLAARHRSDGSAYLKMVLADDWLFPDCIRQMVAVAEAHPTVGLVGAYRIDGPEVGCDGLPYPSTFVPGRELCRMTLLGGPGVFGSATSVLYRSEAVRDRDPMFDEADFHADSGAALDILRRWDFGFVHQVLTYTRRHAAAQTSFAQAMNTYQAAELRHLIRYGRAHLTPTEYTECRNRIVARYCRFLAKSLSEPRALELWRYHTTALADMGQPLGWRHMLPALIPFVGHAFRHPVAAARFGLRLITKPGNRT